MHVIGLEKVYDKDIRYCWKYFSGQGALTNKGISRIYIDIIQCMRELSRVFELVFGRLKSFLL